MHQPQITVLQPLNHRSYSCHYHIIVGFSSKLNYGFCTATIHGEKGERRERNERVLENIPVDVMVRISIFPKLPCCICLASSSKPLQKLIFQDWVPLWREIDFSCVETQRNGKALMISCFLLSAILIRVNYKAVTRTINPGSRDWVF
jgi:hypothetical protein